MILTVDGNIGAGKSTVLELLARRLPDCVSDPEPIDVWIPYLNRVYSEKKSVFAFQVRVWLDRCWKDYSGYKNVVVERSPYFTSEVFVAANTDNLDKEELRMLREMYDLTKESGPWTPDCMIYLRASPEEAYLRIIKRGRECEMKMEMGYLKRVHELHEKAYEENREKIMVVDVDHKTPEQIINEICERLGM